MAILMIRIRQPGLELGLGSRAVGLSARKRLAHGLAERHALLLDQETGGDPEHLRIDCSADVTLQTMNSTS